MTCSDTYHHGDLRTAIIATAIAMAEEDGVPALSIRAIARRLGVSHAAPARHFASRSTLLAGVAAAAFSLFSAELEKSDRGATADARLAALGGAYIRFAIRRPALFRLMFNPEATGDARMDDPELRAASERAYTLLESAVRSLLDDAGDEKVESATCLAWSAAHGAAMLWLDGPLRDLGERNFMRWAKSSMDHIARTLARETGAAGELMQAEPALRLGLVQARGNKASMSPLIEEVPAVDAPLEVLLLADPSEDKVRSYLPMSKCFVASTGGVVVGACLVRALREGTHELMSIAVQPAYRRSGHGTALLSRVIDFVRRSGASQLVVGTGSFGYQLAFYQRHGFRVTGIDRDFFVDNYCEPIFEDGVQLVDMLRLTLKLANKVV